MADERISDKQIPEEATSSGADNSAQGTAPQNASAASEARPQVIVKQEYGVAHYVGIAFITVCAVFLYFMPGIAVVFGVSKITELSAPAAWLFAAIFSIILWFLFQIKLRGFKRSLYLYLAFCTAVFITFAVLQGTGKADIFHGIVRLLLGT